MDEIARLWDEVVRLWSDAWLRLEGLVKTACALPSDTLLLTAASAGGMVVLGFFVLAATLRRKRRLKRELEKLAQELSELRTKYEAEVKWRMAEERYLGTRPDAAIASPNAFPGAGGGA